MFTLLLESRPHSTTPREGRPGQRAGTTLLSVVVHGAIVTLLVVLTASDRTVRHKVPAPERLQMTVATPPEMPPATPAVAAPSVSHSAPATPVPLAPALLPVLPSIVDIPTSIPAIDLSRAPTTDADFASGRRGTTHGVPGGTGVGTSQSFTNAYFSALEVEKPVVLVPGSKGPAFPDVLRSTGTQGTVLAQFVVDSTGRALPDSFVTLHSDHPLFTASVRAALLRMRFVPAEIGGRRVAQLVQQPFQFTLQR